MDPPGLRIRRLALRCLALSLLAWTAAGCGAGAELVAFSEDGWILALTDPDGRRWQVRIVDSAGAVRATLPAKSVADGGGTATWLVGLPDDLVGARSGRFEAQAWLADAPEDQPPTLAAELHFEPRPAPCELLTRGAESLDNGRFITAATAAREALDEPSCSRPSALRVLARAELGQGRAAAAREALGEALELDGSAAQPDRRAMAGVIDGLLLRGDLLRRQGAYAEAVAQGYDPAGALAERLHAPTRAAEAHLGRAAAYERLFRFDDAERELEAAEHGFQLTDHARGLGDVANDRGLVAQSRAFDDRERRATYLAGARRHYLAAVALYRRAGLGARLVTTLNNLALLALDEKRYEDARQHLAEVAERLASAPAPRAEMSLELYRGDLAYYQGRKDAALGSYQRAIRVGEEVGLAKRLMEAHYSRGRVLLDLGRPEEALAAYRAAVEAGDRVYFAQFAPEQRMGFSQLQAGFFRALIALLVERKHEREAFATTEQARARTYLSMLKARVGLFTGSPGASDDVAVMLGRRLEELDHELQLQLELPASERDAQRLATLRNHARTLKTQLTQRYQALRNQHSALRALDPDDSQLDVERLAAGLEPDERVLSWFVLGRRLLVQVLGPQGLVTATVEVERRELRDRVKRFVAGLRDAAKDWREPAAALGALLFERVLDALPDGASVAVVGHGFLHDLPEAALLVRGKLADERWRLRRVPSIALAAWLRDRRSVPAEPGTSILLVGDPRGDLPAARDEVRQLARLAPGATALTGADATESRVRAELGRCRLCFYSGHAEFDAEAPQLSHLLLAGDPQSDGRLTVAEIFGLSLRARLVVLNGCETGRGELNRGDDVLGLARALLIAGADSVVGTLWPVEDRVASEFSTRYLPLLRDRNAAEALGQVRAELRRDHPHPRSWAAYLLFGTGS